MVTTTCLKTKQIAVLFNDWLNKRISPRELAWLEGKQSEIKQGAPERILFTAFSSVSRYITKQKLELSPAELQTAQELITGFSPLNWTVDQVARSLLILSFPEQNETEYIATLDKIFSAADVGELIALYQSLPLLPCPERFKARAAEGVRSNMSSVFNAVALNNPYPAQYLDDLAWNQMVLKALFIDSPLKSIYGLEHRNNRQLSQMLIDYARERLAAQRTVNPELWRLVKPFNSQVIVELESEFSRL